MNSIRTVEQISEKIIHVSHLPESNSSDPNTYGRAASLSALSFDYTGLKALKELSVIFSEKNVYRSVVDGEPVFRKKKTANGEVTYIENSEQIFERISYSAVLELEIGDDEKIFGLGQYEDGIMDYRRHTEYLYESNMRIAIPFFVTTGGYGVYLDSESNMIFTSEGNRVRFDIDTTEGFSYYVLLGDSIDEIIANYQRVTGKASMMPRWIFGYVQSKERYNSSDELLDTADEFRTRRIPVDCIVQDWYSWEEGLWGEKIFDKKRYPDLPGTVSGLHEKNIHFMVSVWPNMSPDSQNYAEFKQAGMLMDNSNLYNAFDERARELYFEQCSREIMDAGSDALWCDNAEPFSDADWSGETKRPERERYDLVVETSKQSMPWEKINAYGLYHAKGIYENWRKRYPEKRVVNLTRSGYAACQKYGTILWSGDITAKWSTMKKQIAEGMKMGLSGMPYWTLDIGGFFVVKDKYENRGCNNTGTTPLWFWDGDYNDGVNDPGYCELYTRWIQFGAFLPIFRSHGTDTPREPWQFDERFFGIITKYINLRSDLIPYIYSMAYMAHDEHYIMMRSFAFDFAEDEAAAAIADEYMFGPAFLVAPVTEPMYYEAGGTVLSEDTHVRNVYLPKGTQWFDFWTHKLYEGGEPYEIDAPLEKLPLFVKAGSIIPMRSGAEYADEGNGVPEIIQVFAGADGRFTLYVDEGDGYRFEQGGYCKVEMLYSDKARELTIGAPLGDMRLGGELQLGGDMQFGGERHSLPFRIVYTDTDGSQHERSVVYSGEKLSIRLS